jgi:hypothetical protein
VIDERRPVDWLAFATRVRGLRKDLGSVAFGLQVGVPLHILEAIEHADVAVLGARLSMHHIFKLASALGASIDWLLYGEKTPLSDRPVTIFLCNRGLGRGHSCKECGRRATRQCEYPLRGARAGHTCSAYLCDRCAIPCTGVDGDTVRYCPTHDRIAKRDGLQLNQRPENAKP